MSTIGERILTFTDTLEINQKLPEGIEILNPYKNQDAWRVNVLMGLVVLKAFLISYELIKIMV